MLHRKPIVPAFLSEEDISGFVQLHADQPTCFTSEDRMSIGVRCWETLNLGNSGGNIHLDSISVALGWSHKSCNSATALAFPQSYSTQPHSRVSREFWECNAKMQCCFGKSTGVLWSLLGFTHHQIKGKESCEILGARHIL